MEGIKTLILVATLMGGIFILTTAFAYMYSLKDIKNKTVGDGQHGTARWATKMEIRKTYKHIPFEPQKWRFEPLNRPNEQGSWSGANQAKMAPQPS